MGHFARVYARYAPAFAISVGLARYLDHYFSVNPMKFVTRTRYGFELEGVTSDLIQRYVYVHGIWEPRLTAWLSRRLRWGDGFVDVGANVGYYTLLASRLVGRDGKVVSIEASPTIFSYLVSNVKKNSASNVRPVNIAITDREGYATVFLGPQSLLGLTSIFSDREFRAESTVSTNSLCNVLTEEELRRARVIKIDVEGAELAAVRGLIPCLAAARRDLELIVEVGGGPRTAPTAAASSVEIIESLRRHGFHAYYVTNRCDPVGFLSDRRRPRPPKRLRADRVETENDLVFSRFDAATL